jgi:hypothetical protein
MRHPPLHADEHGDWKAANEGIGAQAQVIERATLALHVHDSVRARRGGSDGPDHAAFSHVRALLKLMGSCDGCDSQKHLCDVWRKQGRICCPDCSHMKAMPAAKGAIGLCINCHVDISRGVWGWFGEHVGPFCESCYGHVKTHTVV